MKSTFQRVTQDLLVSYEEVGGLNNTDGLNLPSKRAVASICKDLLQLLFPGFHDEEPIHQSALPRLTQHRVSTIAERLEDQVGKSLRIDDPTCPAGRAEDILCKFLSALPGIREILRTDIEAAYDGDPAAASVEEIILSYPCIETIAIQRMAHVLYQEGVSFIPRMMTEWAHARTGIDIHPGARIGSHFFIDHGTGVVIGETCRIGNRVKLYHGVTLGARSIQKDDLGRSVKGGQRHPEVQDGVTVYPNSTILGGETVVGAGSTIGANVFLMHSVPVNSLVYYEETQLKIVAKRERKPAQVDQAAEIEWFI